jgi:methionyl-tRNA synthetase
MHIPQLKKRQILVTSALPYANGDIHIGHLVEYIQTDIWVRFLRMCKHEVYYVCADDTHGTPIMLRAQKEGITPEQLIEKTWQQHTQDFAHFNISFDHYYSTHAPENELLAQSFYHKLKEQGLIETRDIEQAFDAEKNMFLPDRFIKGECPKCGAKEQYGDNCEQCGATYAPTELKNAYSVLSGSAPIVKESTHYFFKLSDQRCIIFLREWVKCLDQTEAINKLQEWLKDDELADWDISRDAPYFGFRIPDTVDKYFYVWLDAPLGYYASFQKLCTQRNLDFNEWIKPDSTTEQYHFIGKDILYFHSLFWPAMLKFAGFRTPTNVFAHGFLTVDGQKMSKSRGTFISAQQYLASGLKPAYLRYYFAAKLNASIEDIDLNLNDFTNRVNSDLVGKYINIASRSSNFLNKYFNNHIDSTNFSQHSLIHQIKNQADTIQLYYEKREFAKVVRNIMDSTDAVNTFIDEEKPWVLAKQEEFEKLHSLCSVILECFRLISIYLKPIIPNVIEEVEHFLNIDALDWLSIQHAFNHQHSIKTYTHLMQRISVDQINILTEIKEV